MKFTFIANACSIVESNDFRILTDPWLEDGVFEGSWCHFPPVRARFDTLPTFQALYISHLHPDHFDSRFMNRVPRDTLIIALDHQPNFLLALLRSQGFSNIFTIAEGETRRLGPFTLTMYAPFTAHAFHSSVLGNLIDSALLFEADGVSILNTNDNTPSVEKAVELAARHQVTLALLNFNAAGPYPSCFDNLSEGEKLAEAARISQRNIDHAALVAQTLGARYVMPFAGEFVLGGHQAGKNRFLGTLIAAKAAELLSEKLLAAGSPITVIDLNEGMWFRLEDGSIGGGIYRRIDEIDQNRYIENVLSSMRYPWEDDPPPARELIVEKLFTARQNLWKSQQSFDCFPDLNIYINISSEEYFWFNLNSLDSRVTTNKNEPMLVCNANPRLLWRILSRASHWNNASVGCHIDYVRVPNVYQPDAEQLLSFLRA